MKIFTRCKVIDIADGKEFLIQTKKRLYFSDKLIYNSARPML